MYEVIFLLALGGIWITFAAIQDIRKREVADWLNYSLIIFAIGFRFFYSLFSEQRAFFVQGVIGLGIFFILGNLLYYGKFFAGGDAKLLIALGAIIPVSQSFFRNIHYFSFFLISFLFTGAVYGVLWSLVLAKKNYSMFKHDFFKKIKSEKKSIAFSLLVGMIFLFFGIFFRYYLFFAFSFLFFLLPYLFLFAKAVEDTCMIKKINTRILAEGDWLYKNVMVGKKLIKSKWDGLSGEEIRLLRKHKKEVLIRQGIPFIPAFWISFLIFVIYLGYSFW
jgi:Flp pilus assembly protein protease CpaA